jgi:hypothetical protein
MEELSPSSSPIRPTEDFDVIEEADEYDSGAVIQRVVYEDDYVLSSFDEEEFEVPIRYRPLRIIGKGAFGVVWYASSASGTPPLTALPSHEKLGV